MLLVSVVIPTYNRPELLMKCLESLCHQRLSKNAYEVIVVTDGPDETTANAITHFALQRAGFCVRCISTIEKKGPAAARNHGWKNAKVELIVFTDDDTLPGEDWIANYYQAYRNAGQEQIAFTGKTMVPVSAHPTDYEKNTAGLEMAEFITANCACSKMALQNVGGFDEAFTMAWREDSDLHFKLMSHQIPIIKVADAIVVHPVRQVRWGVSIREQKKGMFNALLYKKHPQLYKQKIGARPLWNYYTMVVLALLAVLFVSMKWWVAAGIAGTLWLALVIAFTARRLKGTSKQLRHVSEMLYTSAIIPFLSVYWTLYGAVRFKKRLF